MRTWAIVIGLVACASSARAQDGGAPSGSEPAIEAGTAAPDQPEAGAGTGTGSATGAVAPAGAAERRTVSPKVAVVIVGDPDAMLVAAAREIEARALVSEDVRLPSDPSLRATLRGEAGADEDGLEEVRRERRRLGLGESSDAPILQRLGRRAGAVAVVVVRATAAGAEAVVLDVRTGQFFEGSLAMTEPDADAIVPFVARRARVAARSAGGAPPIDEAAPATIDGPGSAAIEGPPPVTAAPGATETPEDDGQDAGEWMEENWPYFAAGALLAAAIVFVAVVATEGGEPPPMLRFQPGSP